MRNEIHQFGLGRLALLVLLTASLVGCRGNRSKEPPVHLNHNMDFQQKFEAQETNDWFTDGTAMRLPVEGTVSRATPNDTGVSEYRVHYEGKWQTVGKIPTKRLDNKPGTIHYFTGLNAKGNRVLDQHLREQAGKKPSEQKLPSIETSDGLPGLPSARGVAEIQLSPALLDRGEKTYNVYCAPCHGVSGYGDGSVALRAPGLIIPSYHGPTDKKDIDIRTYPLGYIFHVITHGAGRMQGYAAQIPVADRWAAAAWVRTLQRSQTAGTQEASN